MAKRPSVPQMRGVEDLLTMTVDLPINSVSLDSIVVSAHQPRRFFDEAKLSQLAASIGEYGILEPLIVRPMGNKYELVAGERRFRAAQILGLSEVPVTCKDLSDEQVLYVSSIENLQREDLNPVEETEAILQLLAISLKVTPAEAISILNQSSNAKNRHLELKDNVILQLEQIATVLTQVGRFTPESFRTNRLPLLKLPEDILSALREGRLEFTKARAIARVKDDLQRRELLTTAIEQNLSLNDIKQQIATRHTPTAIPLQTQLNRVLRSVKKSQIWNDPAKQKQLTELLADLENLISTPLSGD
jgi:ParB family transcriptional regulator, chromosome partitioning protein